MISEGCQMMSDEACEPRWYAAYTCVRHEKVVAESLRERSVDHFLPLYQTVHQWKDRQICLSLPLFPGYVFVHITMAGSIRVLSVRSVVNLVSMNGRPVPLPDTEIEAIRKCLERKVGLQPHPYLDVGRRVRIVRGPLQGCEGIVVRQKGHMRVVINLDSIMQSVALEIDALSLEPATPHVITNSSGTISRSHPTPANRQSIAK